MYYLKEVWLGLGSIAISRTQIRDLSAKQLARVIAHIVPIPPSSPES